MGNFKNLPSDIILDILARLPTESIQDCKLVCKPWKNLVSRNRLFSQLHLTRLNQSTDSGELSFLLSNAFKHLYYFNYDEIETPSDDSIRRIIFVPPFTSHCCNIIGSFNGLICLYGGQDCSAYCICNPVTKEYLMLPITKKRDCGDDGQYFHWSSGFGYLPSTNEYKVVELYKLKKESDFTEVSVYTLGSGHGWRNVGGFDAKSGDAGAYVQDGVFVKGALHWVSKIDGRVFVFDLTEEKFADNVLPPPLPQDGLWHDYSIGELNGVLYYAIRYHHFVSRSWFDIWLLKMKNDIPDMKEQVEHEAFGWSKEFSISEAKPLAFTKSGGILCLNRSSIRIYDPIASTSKILLDFTDYSQIFSHRNTLVSLNEFGEEDVKIMKSAEIREF